MIGVDAPATWVDELCSCRCGSRPIFAEGVNPTGPEQFRCSGFLTCRTPERHGIEDGFAVIWVGAYLDDVRRGLGLQWNQLNFSGGRPS